MNMLKKTMRGTCPFCGSDNIRYDVEQAGGEQAENGDSIIRYPCTCSECNGTFFEFERTTYDGYSVDDDNGGYRDFDADGNEL